MKEVTVKTFVENNQVEDSKLQISEGETLVTVLPEGYTMQQAKRLHDMISDALKGDMLNISVPNGVEFKVIKVD